MLLILLFFLSRLEKSKDILTPTHITKTKESSMPKTPTTDTSLVSSSQKRKAEAPPPKPEKKRPGRPPLSQSQQTPKSVSIFLNYNQFMFFKIKKSLFGNLAALNVLSQYEFPSPVLEGEGE